jgi:hypothetical protein
MATQEVIDYMSGLTGFVFDKDVLNRVALDRHVEESDPKTFDKRTQDLLTADLLLTAYLSPDVWASHSSKHGSYSRSVGAQTLYNKDKIYNYLLGIYKLYDDPKLEQLGEGGTVSFLDI